MGARTRYTQPIQEPAEVRLLTLFVSAVLVGLAFNAPPGPVAAEALRRGLARGFRAALFIELGSLLGDATWAAIALAGAAVVVQNSLARTIIGGAGVFFLLQLSYQSMRDALNDITPRTRPTGAKGDLVTGVLLSVTNPLAIGFWVGVGGGMVQTIIPNPEPKDFAVFFAGFMLACVSWCFVYSAIVAFCRALLRPVFFRALNLICGVGLATFGIVLLLRIVGA